MISLLTYFILALVHPIHISKCQIEVNESSKKLEVTMHIFIDDLQEIIEKQGSPALKLGSEREYVAADSFIAQYIMQHFKIENADRPITYTMLGKEMTDDYLGFWIFLESASIDESAATKIEYSVLHDLYDDQKNLLNVRRADGEELYFLCEKESANVTIE